MNDGGVPATAATTPLAGGSPAAPGTVVLLEPARLQLSWQGSHLRLVLHDHACWPRVTVSRCFPLSHPMAFLSVRAPNGAQVGLIADGDALDADSRSALAAELARRYLTVRILAIRAVTDRFEQLEWELDTDRGPIRIRTKEAREQLVRVSPTHWLLTDSDGRRFEIPDVGRLDEASQRLLSLHL